MIAKYKKRSILCLICSMAMTVGFVWFANYLYRHRLRDRNDSLDVVLIFGYIATWIMWLAVGFNLARAKGYSREFTGSLFVVVYAIGFCVPFIVLAFPLYILFGMEDKTKQWSRRH
jgi:hypothetical protein